MRIDILTLFPDTLGDVLSESILGRAQERGYISIEAHQIRDYTANKQNQVDDYPYGGGAGMVMRADILGRALKANHRGGRILAMSPRGLPLTQEKVHELSRESEISVVCGRFEGIDERVLEAYGIEEVSIGDYILTGGEQAAQVMFDAVIRLLPGVLGNAQSAESESFEDSLLEYPQYTRPVEWEGRTVPEVLLSGHHKKIEDWRKEQAIRITGERRPDLLKKYLDSKRV